MNVYREKVGRMNSSVIANAVAGMNIGVLNWGSFANKTIDSIQITEDKEFGYSVGIDFIRNAISIYQNYTKWPQNAMTCSAPTCSSMLPMIRLSDIPSEQELVTIANQFMKERGIPTTAYGAPQQVRDWYVDYERSADKANAYVPDQVSVVYPIIIDGKQAFEQSGSLAGLYVSIDIRNKKVAGVHELMIGGYESSAYDAETDFDKIVKIATDGGLNPWYPYSPMPMPLSEPASRSNSGSAGSTGIRPEELKLQTPSFGLAKIVTYKDATTQTLYVPALIFPIVHPQGAPVYSYMKNMVVPLVKEILDQPRSVEPPMHIMK